MKHWQMLKGLRKPKDLRRLMRLQKEKDWLKEIMMQMQKQKEIKKHWLMLMEKVRLTD